MSAREVGSVGSVSEPAEQAAASSASAASSSLATTRSLVNLSNSILTTIMEFVVRGSNPGQVIKLALACRALHRAVSEAEGLWEQLSVNHGWSRRPAAPRAGLTAVGSTSTAAAAAASSVLDLDQRWFQYYTHRMACRRSVRRFFRLYMAFLSRPSSLALLPGADPAALSACEQRLGVSLPWELWELYRFRDGQAPGSFVTWVDDMRLLGLDDLLLERHPGLPELRQRLQAMGSSGRQELPRPGLRPGLGETESSGGGTGSCVASGQQQQQRRRQRDGARELTEPVVETDASAAGWGLRASEALEAAAAAAPAVEGSAAAAAAAAAAVAATADEGEAKQVAGMQRVGGGGSGGGAGDDRLLVVASNPSSSRRFLVALDGQVYLARGLSIVFFASSVAGMVQKLLQ